MPDEARDPLAPDGADAAHSPDAWPPRPRPPADLRDRATAVATRYGLSWARGLVGVVVVVGVSVGGWWLLRPPAPPIEQTLPVASAEATGASSPVPAEAAAASTAPPGGTTTTTAPSQVVAHAAGAVARPGVYRLPGSARVDDLVRAAGGLAPKADANRVNLAAPVSDGERVYVPALGETEPPVAVTPDAGAPGGSAVAPGSGATTDGSGWSASSPAAPGAAPSGPVDLNTADLAALDTLPGVGPATAQAIITYRQEHGRFRSVDELLEVRGIGDAKMAELRDRVTVGG
jgi:competence protein ComEA